MRINQKESTEISEFQLGFGPREILPKIWDWGVPLGSYTLTLFKDETNED